jgi:hypothetical protein
MARAQRQPEQEQKEPEAQVESAAQNETGKAPAKKGRWFTLLVGISSDGDKMYYPGDDVFSSRDLVRENPEKFAYNDRK